MAHRSKVDFFALATPRRLVQRLAPKMRSALAVILALALVTFVIAHLAIVVALVVRKELRHAALAFFVPPLAPVYAAERGPSERVLRVAAYAWAGAFALYAALLPFT